MIHDENRVGALRASAKAGIKALDELRDKTTDSGFHQMLVPPGHWFADIESFFIRSHSARRWLTTGRSARASSSPMRSEILGSGL